MELPKDLSWQITTNENGVEMITMPRFKINEIVEYMKYAESELKKLRVGDVSFECTHENTEFKHIRCNVCTDCGELVEIDV